MDYLNAWDIESRVKEILSTLKISNVHQVIRELSGGQKKRVALAKVLIENSDLIIMDEPTNHLDIEMIEWLEEYLSKQNLSILLVTHDRYFLDNVCNDIIELDSQGLYHYKGNYSYYLEKKKERLEIEKSELEKDKNTYDKELEWMRRMPQARTTKSKARIDSFYDLEEKTKRRAADASLNLWMKETRMGNKILEMDNVSKSFGDFVALDDFSYTFKTGDRIGVVGKNGVGKTTFINLILGNLKQDVGKISIGQTIVFGIFKQEGLELKEDRSVIDAVKDIAENIEQDKSTLTASRFLFNFGFSYNIQHSYVSSLSGGEKRRLQLLMVMIQNPNFLILDEPTNDLDIQTLNSLEDFLESYKGCLFMVSHDRYFLDNLTDHLFVFEGNGKVKDFTGNYSEYALARKKELALQKKAEKPKKEIAKTTEKEKPRKPTFKEAREFEAIESEIELLEKEKDTLLKKMNSGDGTSEELNNWALRYGEVEKLLDEKTNRWVELSEIF